MRIRCGIAPLAIFFTLAMQAAPPLTTIADVLYTADGSRFNGVAFIQWKSFQAADLSSIATNRVTVTILVGAIRVRLVPTTNASAGACYSVRYTSDGRTQFDETWAVPPSAAPLKLKDVRASTGSGGGQVLPPAALTSIQESDVVGLVDDLAVRPQMGPGYAPSRAAYITETGALEAVSGGLSDCVRVDGTAGPCDVTANPGPEFVDGEVPAGLVNGLNAVFTLASTPSPASSLQLHRNGVLQKLGLDYTLAGSAITFTTASAPVLEDTLLASYRLAGISGLSGGHRFCAAVRAEVPRRFFWRAWEAAPFPRESCEPETGSRSASATRTRGPLRASRMRFTGAIRRSFRAARAPGMRMLPDTPTPEYTRAAHSGTSRAGGIRWGLRRESGTPATPCLRHW